MKRDKLLQRAINVIVLALSLLIAGCSPAERDSTTDFEPEYIGGYPTEETAEAMFD